MCKVSQDVYSSWFGVDRSTVSYSINHVYEIFKDDEYYKVAVAELMDRYPLPLSGATFTLLQTSIYRADFDWIQQKKIDQNKHKNADVIRMLIKNYESK
jgi:hypothetical protein